MPCGVGNGLTQNPRNFAEYNCRTQTPQTFTDKAFNLGNNIGVTCVTFGCPRKLVRFI